MTKRIFIFLLILMTMFIPLFAENELIPIYFKAANEQYNEGNLSKSYQYINKVLGEYTVDSVPDNTVLLAEMIYYDYLVQISKENNIEAFHEVQEKLIENPYITSDRVNRLLKTITTAFLKKAEAEEKAAQAKEKESLAQERAIQNQQAIQSATVTAQAILSANDELYKRLEGLTSDQIKFTKEFTQELQTGQEKMLDTVISGIQENSKVSSEQTNKVIYILVGIAFLFVLIVVIVIILSLHMAHKQRDLFTQTLRVVSELQRIPYEQADSLRLADVYSGMRAIEQSETGNVQERPALQEFTKVEVNDELRAELRELATECEKEGLKVDKVTNRKNNSKNVAEMVFKIAQQMDLGEYTSMLYFCASMVYDIGFLSLDPDLLEAETLTEDQKYTIRSHVKAGATMLDFVEEKFRPVFVEAVLMHHENLNGSGYPDGLKDKQIPPVARIIRVVESFIAQISRRNYRGIFDKETAIDELRKHPEWYDQSIVSILDGLI